MGITSSSKVVSVIIVNYNTFKITCDCIASVYKFTKAVPFEVIVVDNASPNDEPDYFLDRFPEIILVKSPTNGGFAKGNNLGIAQAKGDIILLLNSDTWLTEDSVGIAAKHLTAHQQIGALTVRLVYPDGRLQHTARKFRSIKNELLDLWRPLLKTMPYPARAKLMLNQYFYGDFDTPCDWVSGAFMMFRKALLHQMPDKQLDERYFMYGEDQLWCYQFMQLGFVNYYLSTTTVVHIHNASTLPAKQLQLLKRMLHLELDFMATRVGKGVYYYLFSIVFSAKEMMRYWIKVVALRFFGKKLR